MSKSKRSKIIKNYTMLSPKKFGLAGGILFGAGMLITAWVGLLSGYLYDFSLALTKFYPGASLTFGGSLLGAAFGFVYAFIGFFAFAWLYNKLHGKK